MQSVFVILLHLFTSNAVFGENVIIRSADIGFCKLRTADSFPEKDVLTLRETLQRGYTELTRSMENAPLPEKPIYWITSSESEFEAVLEGLGANETDQERSRSTQSYRSGESTVLLIPVDSLRGVQKIILFELSRRMYYGLTNMDSAMWVREGCASFYSWYAYELSNQRDLSSTLTTMDRYYSMYLNQAKEIPQLEAIQNKDDYLVWAGKSPEVVTALSSLACAAMVKRTNPSIPARLARVYQFDLSFPSAFETTTGISLKDFQKEFEAKFAKNQDQ